MLCLDMICPKPGRSSISSHAPRCRNSRVDGWQLPTTALLHRPHLFSLCYPVCSSYLAYPVRPSCVSCVSASPVLLIRLSCLSLRLALSRSLSLDLSLSCQLPGCVIYPALAIMLSGPSVLSESEPATQSTNPCNHGRQAATFFRADHS